MNQNIEILGMKIINKGGLLATADIQFNGININQMRVLKNKQGKISIGFPVIHWISQNQHFYQPALEINNETIRLNIEKRLLDEYKERTKHY